VHSTSICAVVDGGDGAVVGAVVGHESVVGRASVPKAPVLMMLESQLIQVKGQPLKALAPIVVTLVGIVTDVSDEH
jgi:hypothetical protein